MVPGGARQRVDQTDVLGVGQARDYILGMS